MAQSVPVEDTNLPRQVIWKGRKVRLVAYTEGGTRPFIIMDGDSRRSVARSEIIFPKKKGKS